jgi:hypothetical protein
LSALVVTASLASSVPGGAAEPTTAECLAASEASLKANSDHHLRAERASLLVCAATSCPADIRRECIRRVDEVNAALPSIIFEVRDAAGADVNDVKVTVDGEALTDRLDGMAVAVDPGPHTFSFEVAGEAAVQKHLVIREAQKDRREVVSLSTGAPPEVFSQLTREPLRSAPINPPQAHSGLGLPRALAIGAAAIGLAALGAGTIFGGVAWAKRDSARNECPGAVCNSEDGANTWMDAKTWGNASTAAFIVGGVGVTTAAVLWFSAGGPDRTPTAQVSIGPGGLHVSGRW